MRAAYVRCDCCTAVNLFMSLWII
ncbi:MAG: hypothetical protein F2863_07625 [Actinobacteria bacterium]|nr:hypothetical protein [Actinomycetota bacterium]